jgi:flagellar biosynthesis protein
LGWIRLATALKQQESLGAVEVIASGRGEWAEKIVEIARESGVPLYKDAGLAKALESTEIGSQIPEELRPAVNQVISFVYRLQFRHKGIEDENQQY